MALGKINSFEFGKDDWDLYIDRLEQYFIANEVKPAMHVPTLISVMGSEAYKLLVNLCTPDKPSSKSFNNLVSTMKDHLQPKPSLLAERFRFRHRVQQNEETVAEYAANLKKMTKHCGFSAINLKENLRDQFVCGLARDYMRQRLFAEDDISFDGAFKLAVTIEAAEADAAVVVDRTCRRGDGEPEAASAMHVMVTGKGNQNNMRSRQGSRYISTSNAAQHGGYLGSSTSGMSGADTGNRQLYRTQFKSTKLMKCRVCGNDHDSDRCRFKMYTCKICNKEGHLKKMCPRFIKAISLKNMSIGKDVEEKNSSYDSDEVNNFSLDTCNIIKNFRPYTVDICVDDTILTMEIDTGSAISCISKKCFDELFSSCKINTCNLTIRYYTGELVQPVGKFSPLVMYKGMRKRLDLYVIEYGKTSLLGRQWISELNITFPVVTVNNVKSSGVTFQFNDFSSKYYEVFADGLGRFTGGTVGFRMRAEARPVFMRARPLAYAMREPVERALEQLVEDGVISPVTTSDWATPIVPVMKKDGSIRVCGDFKLTLNKCLEIDRFPLPRVEDLLAKLHGGKKFTKLDLSQAYAQFELDEESKKYTVINTHKGLFRYNRLIYGLASSPGIFQRKLEQLFCDIPRVGVFLDDVIITGTDDHSHLNTLHEVFKRLQKYGLKVKKEKCTFFADNVTYLGFTISKKGVHTCPEKIQSIQEVSTPKNITELRSFIGLVMYYAKFVPNISNILSPLYNLLKKDVMFVWTEQCDMAFKNVKNILTSSKVLAHYSPDLPLVLTTDASSVGIGAVISHITSDGERPIAYASRVLNASEKSYSQIDKEALSIIYGVRKFHQYLYGRQFTLRTDHKPLVAIFGNKKGIPVMAASRMQRWSVILAGYDYNIEYVRSDRNAADALSRLPVGNEKHEVKEETYISFIQNFLPITRDDVVEHMKKDTTLNRVVFYLKSGWPTQIEDSFKPYFVRHNELYLDMGCVVWGYRLVIPETLRIKVLKELHVGHMGIVKMKSIARSFVWWPGIDADIERTCRECSTCVAENSAPPRAMPQPWPHISEPWSRLHVDFLGPFESKTFLVIIDSTSKWLEIFNMQKTTANAVIKVLRETFARFGIPKEIVSDNGPPFSSKEYSDFMNMNGIKLTFTAIYHPSSNGAAEGAVKLCKRAIKKSLHDGCDIDAALQTYLLAYRNVAHSTTGASPAMLLQRRSLRSRLDLLRGERRIEDRIQEIQSKQIGQAGGASREFCVGDKVWVRNYAGGNRWLEGVVEDKEGSRHYLIRRENGRTLRRHIDQLKKRWTYVNWPSPVQGVSPVPAAEPSDISNESCARASHGIVGPSEASGQGISHGQSSCEIQSVEPPSVRTSKRIVKPVKRYGFEID